MMGKKQFRLSRGSGFCRAGDRKTSGGGLSWKPAAKDVGLSRRHSHRHCFALSGSKSIVKINENEQLSPEKNVHTTVYILEVPGLSLKPTHGPIPSSC